MEIIEMVLLELSTKFSAILITDSCVVVAVSTTQKLIIAKVVVITDASA